MLIAGCHLQQEKNKPCGFNVLSADRISEKHPLEDQTNYA